MDQLKKFISWWSIAAIALVGVLATSAARMDAGQAGAGAVAIDPDDIGGRVTSSKGPEAGVWVIAQTSDLPTKYIKIVVTDDQGRYVLPDLPKASYDIWVRGYGLVDSGKVKGQPGQQLNLTATIAPNAKAAAEYYPANYWYALLQPPPKSMFPGTGRNGNGIGENMDTQGAWIGNIKMTPACTQCHQMGTKATREISPKLGTFKNSVEAWDHRVQVGISGAFMNSNLAPLGRAHALTVFADWTDRIAKGELPQVPPRPQGLERNAVYTLWEWGTNKTFTHDEVTTNKNFPTQNANGLVYGFQELSGDWITVLDPVKHTTKRLDVPLGDGGDKMPYAWAQEMPQPSPYWGDEIIWKGKLSPHNGMFDSKGRLIVTARGACRLYEPKTDKWTILNGCQAGHHVQVDSKDVAWFDAGGAAAFDFKVWDETHDAAKAFSRYPLVLDWNGNGKADPVAGRGAEPTAEQDKTPAVGGSYAVMPNEADNSVWLSYLGVPGALARIDLKTKLAEVYEPPYKNPAAKVEGYLPHGVDVDLNGVVWTGLNSGHLASFDRKKCKKPYNPKAERLGQQCTEGWTLYQAPGPQFKGVTESGSADSYYLNWVDQYDTSGLGKNTPFLNGSGSDALYALVNGKFVTYRVPYPLGFMSRGMDGRIDDPKGGWKGRAIWTTHAEQSTWHQEGGTSELPNVIKIQNRPNPLAK
jgi:hypothetical protein